MPVNFQTPLEKPNHGTIEQLQTHPLWHQATERQRVFILKYIETSNRVEAAFAAFKVRGHKGADSMANRALRQFVVRKLLAVYYGYDLQGSTMTKSELKAHLSNRLRDPDLPPAVFSRLASLYAEVCKWKKKSTRNPELSDEESKRLSGEEEEVLRLVKRMETQRYGKEESDESTDSGLGEEGEL